MAPRTAPSIKYIFNTMKETTYYKISFYSIMKLIEMSLNAFILNIKCICRVEGTH